MPSVAACEEALDRALKDLRKLRSGENVMAQASIEYRIGALRRRRASLQETEA